MRQLLDSSYSSRLPEALERARGEQLELPEEERETVRRLLRQMDLLERELSELESMIVQGAQVEKCLAVPAAAAGSFA